MLNQEHHYQFKQLSFHGKLDESYRVLEAETGFQAMKIAQQVLPDDLTKPEWQKVSFKEMISTNVLKYQSCEHTRSVLLASKVILAEATTNAFWGSGLPPDLTVTTFSDYWPGKNNLGKILVCVREDIVSDMQ